MSCQISSITDHPKAGPLHAQSLDADSAARPLDDPKVLGLSGVLQTTLDINKLFALLSEELGKVLSFNGVTYQFPELDIDIKLGKEKTHKCAYDLVVMGDKLGTVSLSRRVPFSEQELTLLENHLSALLYPLRNALLYQKALTAATTDPVTGVKNRSAMEDALKRDLGLAGRQDTDLSIILFDIDHFKQVNDRFGHNLGDMALRTIANCAAETIRDSDIVFRYGGEEFLILLTGTGLNGAAYLAERIRKAVETMDTGLPDDHKLTVSLGVVTAQEDEHSSALIERADQALYQAKHNGRNLVVTA
jgi:diguanylate cyclase (GGDEF)-like protein